MVCGNIEQGLGLSVQTPESRFKNYTKHMAHPLPVDVQTNLLTLAFELTKSHVRPNKNGQARVMTNGHHAAQYMASMSTIAYGRYLDAQAKPLTRAKRLVSSLWERIL